MIKLSEVAFAGEAGRLQVDSASLRFVGHAGSSVSLSNAKSSICKAELTCGKLRLILQSDSALVFDGIEDADTIDILRNHFSTCFNVDLLILSAVGQPSGARIDDLLDKLEECACQMEDAPALSVRKMALEANLLKEVEEMRDIIEELIRGDKQHLSCIFAADDCKRIGRLRILIDLVKLEVNHTDRRWVHIRECGDSVEAILKDLGLFKLWQAVPLQSGAQSTRYRKQWPEKSADSSNAPVNALVESISSSLPQAEDTELIASDAPAHAQVESMSSSLLLHAEDTGLFAPPPGAEYEEIEAQYAFPDALPQDPHVAEKPASAEIVSAPDQNCIPVEASVLGHQVTENPLRAVHETERVLDPLSIERSKRAVQHFTGSSKLQNSIAPAVILQELLEADGYAERARRKAHAPISDGLVDVLSDSEVESDGQSLRQRSRRLSLGGRLACSSTVLQTWLWKKSRFLKQWRRRWVVLTSSYLATFMDPSGRQATDIFLPSSISNVGSSGLERQNRVFCIMVESREVFFVCEDERERRTWMRGICNTLHVSAPSMQTPFIRP